MIRLNKSQIEKKKKFITEYISAKNPADGSKLDANANVSNKNLATLNAEIHKDINIQINRSLIKDIISEKHGEELAEEYIRQIENHEIYIHDETSLFPYTYGCSESIVVFIDGKKTLTTFDILYNRIYKELPETTLDNEKGVYGKYPKNLEIETKNGNSKITRIIRKNRHRDMVRIKTKFGEDLIVTDNHPMIVDTNKINDNINAIDSINMSQFKQDTDFEENIFNIETMLLDIGEFEDYGDYCLFNLFRHKIEGIKKEINLNEKLGYFIGYFIGDGHYTTDFNGVSITSNDEKKLKQLASILYTELGLSSKIYGKTQCPSHKDRKQVYRLTVNSNFLKLFLQEYFLILPNADRKSLPKNILETNKKFIDGIISGLIDSDGSVRKQSISIRLSSRTVITQLSILLRAFNFGISMTFQEQNELAFGSFSSNYPIFGINFGLSGQLSFNMSDKVNYHRDKITTQTRYKKNECVIGKVTVISNKSYLKDDIYDITTENEQFLCNNIQVHNCVSISLYPFLLDGLQMFGGDSKPPKHLHSFNGGFINLLFAISSQFAGAVATVEWLMYFDHFARQDYGDDYLENETDIIKNQLQHTVYALNQPASARGFQSIFWNISIYDKFYFESMFGNFVFPDGSKPKWETLNKLQKFFMKWFNKEREVSLLTFPVVTVAFLHDNKKPKDEAFGEMVAEELSEGNAFFIFNSSNVYALSSCCRLKNDVSDSINDFSYSLGAGGVSTGSMNVITINMNRLIQDERSLEEQVEKIHKYQLAFRDLYEGYINDGMLPVYDAGFITTKKQYLTIGLNGVTEGAEYLGYEISNNVEYKTWLSKQFKIISDLNKINAKKYGVKFNTEMVPAENLGVKFANWDKKAGYKVNRDVYNSYLYIVEDESINILDKFVLHGKETSEFFDGGSAYHCNLESYPTKEAFKKLINVAIQEGCEYFCFNIKVTCCEECGFINKQTINDCIKCNSKNIYHATRVIGYLKRIKDFASDRQKEEALRFYK